MSGLRRRTVSLCILDGWGLSESAVGNAVAQARTPHFDSIFDQCPSSTLITHGESVGLPSGSIGNSEVGHLHIGAGRTVLMDMQRINTAIADQSFQTEPSLCDFARTVQSKGGRIHVMGLVTDIGVHALLNHLVASVDALDVFGQPIHVHAFTDGRDSAPGLAAKNLSRLVNSLPSGSRVGTVSGRYYAMDRDRRWERVELAWQAIAQGQGLEADNIEHVLERGESDEFITPTVVGGYQGIGHGDGVFFVNFRSDRMRQLAASLADPSFDFFDVSDRPLLSAALSMTPYFGEEKSWIQHMYARPELSNTLGEWVAAHKRTQFRLAETEKYPHVTYFLNGGKEQILTGEKRYMAPSPKVATYDLAPQMAALEVTQKFIEATEVGYDLIVANFANPDMVGHTGSLTAAIKACETVDSSLGLIVKAVQDKDGVMLVTADHGNCETMIDVETGAMHTAHTTNPVPIILVGGEEDIGLQAGSLIDVAPTILDLMEIEPPQVMTGRSLLTRG